MNFRATRVFGQENKIIKDEVKLRINFMLITFSTKNLENLVIVLRIKITTYKLCKLRTMFREKWYLYFAK